jgi:hypothetical protein
LLLDLIQSLISLEHRFDITERARERAGMTGSEGRSVAEEFLFETAFLIDDLVTVYQESRFAVDMPVFLDSKRREIYWLRRSLSCFLRLTGQVLCLH